MKIISQETIKPSSPTPPHLRTHVLSLADSVIPGVLMEFSYFYKNYRDGDIINANLIKKSLSQCLTHYYPFAGRLSSPPVSAIDCNDEGVEFVEAAHDRQLDDFIQNYEMLHDLVPSVSSTSSSLLHVQLNHFKGGGVAISISISHVLADGFTAATFVDQWAKIARGEPSFKPNFFTSSTTYRNANRFEVESRRTQEVKQVRRSFVFPNSKLNKLKEKVISMGIDQNSVAPTRVEVLTSLVFKCLVDSATAKYGVFRPSILLYPVNMRKKIFNNDPERAVGNILSLVIERMVDSDQMALNDIVGKLMRGKKIEEKDVIGVGERLAKTYQKLGGDATASGRMYWSSSFCWFPLYEVDFGWGKPVSVRFVVPDTEDASFTLLDTPNKDGIEVIVKIPEDEMMIFQHNKDLLAYHAA